MNKFMFLFAICFVVNGRPQDSPKINPEIILQRNPQDNSDQPVSTAKESSQDTITNDHEVNLGNSAQDDSPVFVEASQPEEASISKNDNPVLVEARDVPPYEPQGVLLRVSSETPALSSNPPKKTKKKPPVILNYENENDGKGNYHFSFDTDDGFSRTDTITIENKGTANETLVIRGSFTYQNTKNETISVIFTADKDGFDIIPVVNRISSAAIASLAGGGIGKR